MMTTYTIRINDNMTLGRSLLSYLKTLSRTSDYVDIVKPKTYKMLPAVTLTDEEMERIEEAKRSGIRSDIENLQAYLKSQYEG